MLRTYKMAVKNTITEFSKIELGSFGAILSGSSVNCELTHIKPGCKAAAGDPEVVGILLSEQELHVRVPEFDVSVGAAGHEHLVAGRKAAGHHTGLADRAASGNNDSRTLGKNAAQAAEDQQEFL